MMRLLMNALAASAGGGLTYIRNVVPLLARRDDVRTTLVVGDTLRGEIAQSANVSVITDSTRGGSGARFVREQLHLPDMIRSSGADVLISTGNFALFRSPVPQILLSRNALYRSVDFIRDLGKRGDYRLLLDTKIKGALARWSVLAADLTVAPSETFAKELSGWTGKPVVCIHHGFDRKNFFRDSSPLATSVEAALTATSGAVRVLFVSHYNYYRNFETLIRAIAKAKQKLHSKQIRLVLTCKLEAKENPGSYGAETAAALVRGLGVENEIVELGPVPYRSLHHLYRACDLYVTPAYAETFAHPLVEAMASGLPVIASDLAVHREICGEAAEYFARFSAEEVAEKILELSEFESKRAAMREAGFVRAGNFSWEKHVDALLGQARRLADQSA